MTTIVTSPTSDFLADIASANDYDTVLMRGGTYAPAFVSNAYFKVTKKIILANYPSEPPALTFGDSVNAMIVYVTAGATLHGLTVIGTYAMGGPSDEFTQVNIQVAGNELITIEDCVLTGYSHCGIKSQWDNPPLLIQRVEIGQGGFDTTDHAIYIGTEADAIKTIRWCNLHNALGAGLHLFTNERNVAAYGNVIHHNTTFGGLITGGGHTIVNNVFADNGKGLDLYHTGLANLVIQNNIAWANTYDFYAELTGAESIAGIINHNCYGNSNSALMQGAGDVTTDPCFVGPFTDPAIAWLGYRLDCPRGRPTVRDIAVPITGVDRLLDPRKLTLATKAAGALRSMGPWDYNG